MSELAKTVARRWRLFVRRMLVRLSLRQPSQGRLISPSEVQWRTEAWLHGELTPSEEEELHRDMATLFAALKSAAPFLAEEDRDFVMSLPGNGQE